MARLEYKDSTTGNMKTLGVKVEDTLPIGTEVDYNGSTIPEGWIEVTDDYITENFSLAGKTISSADAGLEVGAIPTNGNKTWIGSIIKDGNGIQGQATVIANSGILYFVCSKSQTFGNNAYVNITHLYR